jgi:Tfp pilus assembly protein FimT
LVIVIAIIALMSAIAVPGLMRIGVFSKDEARGAARELLTLMKAAQNYATTYRVDTALIYTVTTVTDSQTSNPVQMIDGVAIVRRMTKEEYDKMKAERAITCTAATCDPLVMGSESSTDYPFVPLTTEEGKFTTFKKNVGVLVTAPTATQTGPQYAPVRVYMPSAVDASDGFAILPRINKTPTMTDAYVNEYNSDPAATLYPDPTKTRLQDFRNSRFPAHIFKPNGTMEGALGRMAVYVTAAPNALPQERFADANNTTPIAPYVIELYPTMGRLKITYGNPT